MRKRTSKDFIDQRLHYKNVFYCKVNQKMYKIFIGCVLDLDGKKSLF